MRRFILFCIGFGIILVLCGCEGDYTAYPPQLSASPSATADGAATASPAASPEAEQEQAPTEEALPETEEGQIESIPEEEAPQEEAPAEEPPAEPQLLASAETELLDRADARLHNLKLAAAQINEIIIRPGKEFSFNQIVGPRTAEAGYRRATVIVKEVKKQDYGGGVCQISSTVYQAAKAAGLSIQERHSHHKDVGYASQGSDAAVNYDSLDMRFINNTEKDIQVFVSVGRSSVVSEIYQLP